MDGTEDIVELLLTTAIYNEGGISPDDLPRNMRQNYWDPNRGRMKNPIEVAGRDVEKIYEIKDAQKFVKSIPFIDYIEFGSKIRLINLEMGTKWFLNRDDSLEKVNNNPVLARYFVDRGLIDIDCDAVKRRNPPLSSDRGWTEFLLNNLSKDKKMIAALDLVKIYSPEDILFSMEDLVLTEEQLAELEKMAVAIENSEYLRRLKLYDIGKLLFIGPPGTGKTTLARATTKYFGLPMVEVRISMIIDQYLGETSKNIDRVFELAKRISPCILFIDEFDFIAKTRTSDEHSAVKRAVNTLLKSIDEISLVGDGVLLIGATNHPQLLDIAAWRRFDAVVYFPLPDDKMRERILKILLSNAEGEFDLKEIVKLTEGFSGSDLRLAIKGAVLGGLKEKRKDITEKDLLRSINEINRRKGLKEEIGRYFRIE
ncbi:MAG: VCP-like ATPase [Candidatus Methanolliviera sp. GoM_asphalt]|nr:MAG: VCP-like ATPase [Candidatus Methanolliviera sp. GoM_asphalt]